MSEVVVRGMLTPANCWLSCSSPTCSHSPTNPYTYTNIYIHIQTFTHIYIYIHTCIHIHSFIYNTSCVDFASNFAVAFPKRCLKDQPDAEIQSIDSFAVATQKKTAWELSAVNSRLFLWFCCFTSDCIHFSHCSFLLAQCFGNLAQNGCTLCLAENLNFIHTKCIFSSPTKESFFLGTPRYWMARWKPSMW